MNRSDSCLKKMARMDGALHHREVDRVPVSDFFWGSFLERWRRELGLPPDTDIYRYYDLDWIAPPEHGSAHQGVRDRAGGRQEIVVRTGYEAVIRKKFADPMPGLPLVRYRHPGEDGGVHLRRSHGTSGGCSRAGDNQLAAWGTGSRATAPPGSKR